MSARALPTVEEAQAAHGLEAEHDVFGHGEDGHQHEVLVDHADAPPDGVTGIGEMDRVAVDADLARIGVHQAEQDVHQRRLAGAVLPQQAVDLARLESEVDAVVSQ